MRWGKTIAAVAAVGCGLWIGSMLTTYANSIPAAGQPGSTEDPVVTKSYVDEQIQRALSGQPVGQASGGTASSAQLTQLTERVAQLEKKVADAGAGGVPYEVVKLTAGHTLLGSMGTEFIVRTGKAFVYSNVQENGIPDLTDGIDLKHGQQIPNNHHLMVPREGRGVKVAADYPNNVYVTVKGTFVELDVEGNVVVEK